jgi:hypothetical protein
LIGVLSAAAEARVVEEFFQLFKTPWEFFAPGRSYDLLISTLEEIPESLSAPALVVYQSCPMRFDEQLGVIAESRTGRDWVEWNGGAFPVYGRLATLQADAPALVRRQRTPEMAGCFVDSQLPTVRIGFDLFYEVGFLLSKGQPSENARVPTLDLHISLLRAIMATLGVSFVEVPPVPAGYDFMVCLTHDVDFVGIRDHKCDHTMWGFLYRSLIGSFVAALRGEQSWSRCRRNWAAALSLPLVHLGLRDDFWLEFDRYLEIERDLGSTFFFIPFKSVAGTVGCAPAPPRRAARYDLAGIRDYIVGLLESGCEIGLHGIDAWQNSQSGRAELNRIQELTGHAEMGTRMHWLYWNEASPRILEEAGFSYDSTFGYNDAVGFRAGTAQAFCPLSAERMLELPLTIQDSAMFYPGRMKLSEEEALSACKALIRSVSSSGGALTVNWHTRSLSPERLWGDFYAQLLREIQGHRVWFGTAKEVVGWFRKRRALRFGSVRREDEGMRVALSSPTGRSDPPFTVRIHQPTYVPPESEVASCMLVSADHPWNGADGLENTALTTQLEANRGNLRSGRSHGAG